MRSQVERDEQTLDIVSTLLIGLLVFGVPIAALLVLFSAVDLSDDVMGVVFTPLIAGYFAFVVVRLRDRR